MNGKKDYINGPILKSEASIFTVVVVAVSFEDDCTSRSGWEIEDRFFSKIVKVRALKISF